MIRVIIDYSGWTPKCTTQIYTHFFELGKFIQLQPRIAKILSCAQINRIYLGKLESKRYDLFQVLWRIRLFWVWSWYCQLKKKNSIIIIDRGCYQGERRGEILKPLSVPPISTQNTLNKNPVIHLHLHQIPFYIPVNGCHHDGKGGRCVLYNKR